MKVKSKMSCPIQASESEGQPEKEESMTALFAAFIETAGKFLILGAAAFFGVVCGKKFRDRRNKQ